MQGQDSAQPTTEDFLTLFGDRVQRIARVMTGSPQAALASLGRIETALAATAPADVVEATRLGWRAVAHELQAVPAAPQGILPAPSDTDQPAQRLALALSALPARKRLVLLLHHQGGLSSVGIADALGMEDEAAARLLQAAEGHLAAIVQARGDHLDVSPRPDGPPAA